MDNKPERMTFREAQSHIDPTLVASIIRAAQAEFRGVYPDSILSLAVGPTQAILGLAVARGMIRALDPAAIAAQAEKETGE